MIYQPSANEVLCIILKFKQTLGRKALGYDAPDGSPKICVVHHSVYYYAAIVGAKLLFYSEILAFFAEKYCLSAFFPYYLASVARASEGWVIFEASLRRGVRKSLSLPHFKNNSIFCLFFISDCQIFCTFAPAFRKECKRYIETTKRYARLADGNVGNFQM